MYNITTRGKYMGGVMGNISNSKHGDIIYYNGKVLYLIPLKCCYKNGTLRKSVIKVLKSGKENAEISIGIRRIFE